METVTVSGKFLEGLSNAQNTAADRIETAGGHGDTFAGKLIMTHGIVCAPSNPAIVNAESARQEAAAALVKVSRQLAQRLVEGLKDYGNTDSGSAGTLNNQMPLT